MTGLHILAVDDDPVTPALLERHLPPRRHRLDTVGEGSAALERVDTIAYTEHNAAETIGRLEMEVARRETALENISRCLWQPDASAPEKLGEMASLLSRVGLPP